MRFLTEYKESVDMMITLLKKCFNSALKITEMVNGDTVLQHMGEILTNIELTTTYFPDSMLETVRNTTLPLFMGNVYSLMIGPVKRLWLLRSHI